ncbi:MAG: nucleotidyltransferase family protein [Bacteroidota bacterium]
MVTIASSSPPFGGSRRHWWSFEVKSKKKNLIFVRMKTRIEIENKLKEIKPLLISEYSVSEIGYFGSFAADNQTENSDIDILVEFAKPIGWRFFTLEKYLEDIFGIKVDLVTKNALKKQLRAGILKKVRYI